MKRALRFGALIAVTCAACSDTLPPAGQLKIYVTTDAPLPPPAGVRLGDRDPAPLFDRMAIDVFAPGRNDPCAECARDFAIDARQVDDGRASFGVVPTPGVAGYRARVRLYRSASARRGIRASSSVEVVVALPATPTEGVLEGHVVLRTDDVAKPRGSLDEPIALGAGRSPRGLVGSWPGARVVECAGSAAADEACVPGAAYWMGGADAIDVVDHELGGVAEHVAVLPPFFIDRDEVTVRAMREGSAATATAPVRAGTPDWDDCTFTDEPSTFDDYAVTCVGWRIAVRHCEARGRRLPTEAELEYLMGGRRGARYVWGEDEPKCDDAVFHRREDATVLRDCRDFGIGPAPIRSGARDLLRIGDAEVRDLAGGVSEWASDSWSPDDGPCWPPGVLMNPRCTPEVSGDELARSHRGGSYAGAPGLMRPFLRQRIPNVDKQSMPALGFRCARDAL